MKTPIEIVADHFDSPEARKIAAEWVAAIEVAGFVIIHPDRVTEGMLDAFRNEPLPAYSKCIAAALRAAPKWSFDGSSVK